MAIWWLRFTNFPRFTAFGWFGTFFSKLNPLSWWNRSTHSMYSINEAKCLNYENKDVASVLTDGLVQEASHRVTITGPDYEIWNASLMDYGAACQTSYAAVHLTGRPPHEFSEVSPLAGSGVLVSLYDGKDGYKCSKFLQERFSTILSEKFVVNNAMSRDVVRDSMLQIESEYLSEAFRQRQIKRDPTYQSLGSSCLVCIVWNGSIFIGNLGDSLAVLGHYKAKNELKCKELNTTYNINHAKIRQAFVKDHPDVEVDRKDGRWYIITQGTELTKAIGFSDLKKRVMSEVISADPEILEHPISESEVISADPEILEHTISEMDKFVICASSGFWNFMSKEEAIKVVHRNLRKDSAKRLVIKAMDNFGKDQSQEQLKHTYVWDDITAVVIFLGGEGGGTAVSETFRAFVDGPVGKEVSAGKGKGKVASDS